MKSKLLSICIPIYNNAKLFKYSLEMVADAILGFDNEVEIVISDNCSEDNIEIIVQEVRNNHPSINILYSRSNANKGLAYNFHRVIELAEGEYCWIIGSDDFLLKDSIGTVLKVIKDFPHISFISVSYAHINLPSVVNIDSEDPYKNISSIIREGSKLTLNKVPFKAGKVICWDKLVDPLFDNVMLGAVMAGIFKKANWESVDRDEMDKSGSLTNIQNTYPHVFIHANSMVGEPAYFISDPLLVVGDGERSWQGEEFWVGNLPIIYLKIFNEIVEVYKNVNIDKKQLRKCKLYVAQVEGRYLFPYFKQKIIRKKQVKNEEYIRILDIVKRNWLVPKFYVGVIKGVIKGSLMKG